MENVRVHQSPSHCPYCKGDLADLKAIVACAACGARHHETCHSEHGSCATCGAADVLVPRAPATSRARQVAEGPPKGSKIRVDRIGDALVYSWPNSPPVDLLRVLTGLFILGVITIPIAIYLLWYRTKHPWTPPPETRARFVLGPESLEVFSTDRPGVPAIRTVARADVGGVRVIRDESASRLAVDVGVKETVVCSGHSPAELEWLAGAVEAWKRGGA